MRLLRAASIYLEENNQYEYTLITFFFLNFRTESSVLLTVGFLFFFLFFLYIRLRTQGPSGGEESESKTETRKRKSALC